MIGPDLAQRIEHAWIVAPEALAIEFAGSHMTWRELHDFAGRLDRVLSAHGIGPHRPVGVLLRNAPVFVAALLALFASRRRVVSVNPQQPAGRLVREIPALEVDAVLAIHDDWSVPGLREAVAARGALGLELPEQVAGEPRIAVEAPARDATREDDADDIALEMLTSGTTGPPKRIRLRADTLVDALVVGLAQAEDRAGRPQPKTSPTVVAGPLVHVSGFFGVLMSVCEARPIVLLERFNVERWVDAIRRHRIRFASLPPTPMRMVVDAGVPREDLSSLIAVRAGTAPLPAELQRRFEERYGIPVLVQYGATEWMGGVAGWTLEDHRRFMPAKLGSVGRALRGVRLRVIDPDSGAEQPVGTQGVLEVHAPSRLGRESQWTRTTDLASLDADGFLYIHGRCDDVIIRGGFKVSLAQVSDVLIEHPAVQDAIVIGVADERLGQAPVAVIECRPGLPAPSADELAAFCRERLLAYQVPVRFLVVDELPRTPSLKVSRPDVTELLGRLAAQH